MKTKITNKFFVMIISIAMIFTMLVGTAVVANAADGDACELCTYENGICSVCGGYQEATLTTDTYDMDGDGMNDSVYEIANAGQLYWFARLVNIDGQTTANGVLTDDIDLENRRWYPIGLYEDPAEEGGDAVISEFAGQFDGQGHSVSNFSASGNYKQGLFGSAVFGDSVSIRNLGVVNAKIQGAQVGAVLGSGSGVTNCYAVGCEITISTSEHYGCAGAVVGDVNGSGSLFAYDCKLIDATDDELCNAWLYESRYGYTYWCDVEFDGNAVQEDEYDREVTYAQLVSGELAYILNGNSLTGAWGQDLSLGDTYPMPNGEGLSAQHNAVIYSQNVNLGADLSMKYKVAVFDSNGYYANNALSMAFTFLGQKTVVSEYEIGDGFYVFNLEGINPQCMGDKIDAVLYAGATEIDSKLGYSVKENLVNVYEATTDEVKQLIIDTLEYGAAAQTYRGYRTDSLVTDGVSFISNGKADTEVPESNYEYTGATTDSYVDEVTVHFSNTNHIKVKDQSGAYTESVAIAAYDFAVKHIFSADGGYTLKYSVNDYCYDIISSSEYTDEMKALAKALYNYGLSAHIVRGDHTGGAATCKDRSVCDICGLPYGELSTEHSFDENGKCTVCEMTAQISVTAGETTKYASAATDLNAAMSELLAQGERDITVNLPANAEATLFTAIRRALIDTDGVSDGSINLTLTGVTAVPNHDSFSTAIFGVMFADGNGEILDESEYVTQLASVNLPDALTVGDSSFQECMNLTAVTAPKVQTVGDAAFAGTALSSVNFPEATHIGFTSFLSCGDLTTAIFPKAVDIGNQAFAHTALAYLELAAEGAISIHVNALGYPETFSDSIDLVLNCNKQSEITDGLTWNGFTFKSITLQHGSRELDYQDNEDGTHDGVYTCCGMVAVDNAAHNMTYTSNGTIVQIRCDTCGGHRTSAFINVDNKTYDGVPVEATVHGTGYFTSYTYNIVYSVKDGEELDSAPVNAGTYTASFTLEGATASVEFTIAPKTVGLEDVSLDKESYDYTGEEIKPAVIVDGVTLIEGTDYTATYVNNTDVGDATITITFCGNYFGAVVTMTFEIVTPQNASSFDGAGTQPSASSAA